MQIGLIYFIALTTTYALRINPEPIEMTKVMASTHEMQMQAARKLFSLECGMVFHTAEYIIELTTPDGKFNVTQKGFIKDGVNIGDSLPKAYVCTATDTGATPGSMAVFSGFTTISYLNNNKIQKRGGKDPNVLWNNMNNHHCWAKQHNKYHILFIGDVSKDMTGIFKTKDPDAVWCPDQSTPSNHYLRALFMKAIVDEKPEVGWIQMTDLDAYFTPYHFSEDVQTRWLDPFDKVDIVGQHCTDGVRSDGSIHVADSEGKSYLVNAAVLSFRNSKFTSEFLGNWFKNRCGDMDQGALWNTLFQVFKKEDPTFQYDQRKMASYVDAKRYAPHKAYGHFGPTDLPHLHMFNKYKNDKLTDLVMDGYRDGKHPFLCHGGRDVNHEISGCWLLDACEGDQCKC